MIARRPIRVLLLAATMFVSVPVVVLAQQVAAPPGAAGSSTVFSQQSLDQMLAPIALYPDDLLSQVLMAATYPIEVVQADRFVKANPQLQGDPLADSLEQQPWDPSVKSLVNFPDVLSMMSEKLDWTTQIGDAFLSQQQQVMDTVQSLRAKAQAAGTLQNNQQEKIVIDSAGGPPEILIQPATPDVVYVPVYDPNVVYGTWWYPNDPPDYYYPPDYVRGRGIWYGRGYHYGVPWGYAWGAPDWRIHAITLDLRRNENYNRRIDRDRYRVVEERHDPQFHGNTGTWEHDTSHRRGVGYRDPAVRDRLAPNQQDAERQREAYRGRENTPVGRANPIENRAPDRSNDRGSDRSNDRTPDRTPDNGRTAPGPRAESPNNNNRLSQQPANEVRPPGNAVQAPPNVVKAPPNVVQSPSRAADQQPQPDPANQPRAQGRPIQKEPARTPANDTINNAPRTPARQDGAFNDMDRGSAARNESQRGSESRNPAPQQQQQPNANGGRSGENPSAGGGSSGGPRGKH